MDDETLASFDGHLYDETQTRKRWLLRILDWVERHTTGEGTWPWGCMWMWKGFSFHFASGIGGFAIVVPLPRMLPGFVRPYQVQSMRTRAGRRESDLRMVIPLLPPGLPSASRTMRLRGRKR